MQEDGEVSKTKRGVLLLLLILLAVSILYNATFSFSFTIGPNYRNISVDTQVNITNAAPEIRLVTLADPITLTAGTTRLVECNVSVEDFNGYADILNMTGVFFHSSSSALAADDNNTHYSNASCVNVSQNGDFKNFTCGFHVWYYALNGTWTCNVTVNDTTGFNDTGQNTTTINQLLALNVSDQLINYGNLSIGDTSANQSINITNLGNVPINISVKGYGAAENDSLAFVCSQGNIAIENERFSTNKSALFAQKTNLSSAFQSVTNLTIIKQNDSTLRTNTTYWQVYVPPNPFGVCNGTVVFQAETST